MIELDSALQDSEQYYSTLEFVRVTARFNILDSKLSKSLVEDIEDVYDHDLGICDECDRTNDRCECDDRWNDYYDDDEYDRRNDR